jgi:hypothetical protein
MDPRLKRETKKLQKSWMQYEPAMLRDYLVEDQEDPRINIQSILTRHFLLEHLFGNRFEALRQEELRFGAVLNWLLKLFAQGMEADDAHTLQNALVKRADHAAGFEIPHFVSKTFAGLPATRDGLRIPNYIAQALRPVQIEPARPGLPDEATSVFQSLWRKLLARRRPPPISMLEPACGSANDYRFLESFGLARLLDYTGFDLCAKNIANARALFPDARFGVGNVFEIRSRARAFDACCVHDLFEHLSIKGMEAAIAEICRVTRRRICAHFFNMAEIDDHIIRPTDDYHWNTLSMARVREEFTRHAATVQVLHIGTFLRWSLQCPLNYNDGAYTFIVTV